VDSLDLDALRQQGEQYRRLARRRLVRLVFVFALLLLIYFTVRIDPSGYGTLYRFENSTWHVVPGPFAGVPYEVKISSANTVWVYTTIFGGLYRYDGKAWTAYDRRDFNTKSDNISSFTLQGEDVWAIADTSVVHWDGSH